MVRKGLRNLMVITVTSLLLTATAGLSWAHDTGTQHTHDPLEDGGAISGAIDVSSAEDNTDLHIQANVSMPKGFLVVPFSGDASSLPLLWYLMMIGPDDADSFSVHRFMHWHDIPHGHGIATQRDCILDVGGDLSSTLAPSD